MCVVDDYLVTQLRPLETVTNSVNLIQHQGCIANALQIEYSAGLDRKNFNNRRTGNCSLKLIFI